MRTLAVCTLLLVVALVTPAPLLRAEEPDAAPGEDLDPWVLVIGAERYGVMIDRAREGLFEGPPAMTLDEHPDDLVRAAASLRHAAHALYALREVSCDYRVVDDALCAAPLAPPDWLGEPPRAAPSAEEVSARIDWLTEHMWPYVEAGCDAGASRQGPDDPDFCAVE